MSRITFIISYAGLQLQVAKSEQGEDVTPLKPISDLFGLSWSDQKKKIGVNSPTCGGDIPPAGTHFSRRLGVCTLLMGGADGQKREQNCILLSRVAAFLMSINPDKVRGQGNIAGADFLEAKITEWDDAIHDYEEIGVAVNLNHVKHQELLLKQQRHIAQLIAIKNKTEPPHDRKLLEQMIGSGAKESGLVYQPDLIDTGST
jgi:hypothetical protein